MPSFKKPEKGLVWDAFPAPPPEAANWQPDPDSIARTGALADPRFGKDPWEEARLRKARKQFGYHIHHSSEVTQSASSSSSSVSAAPMNRPSETNWPAQVPRQSHSEHHAVRMAREWFDMSARFAPTASLPTSATERVAEASKIPPPSKTIKGTMRNFQITSVSAQRPLNSAGFSMLPKSASSEKREVPAWAGGLEKPLAEDTPKTRSILSQHMSKSVPPHLRKRIISEGLRPAQDRKLDSVAMDSQPISLEACYEAACETNRRVSGSSQAKPEERDHTLPEQYVEVPMGMLLGDAGEQPATTEAPRDHWRDHGHYMKVSLVVTMEMDLLRQKLRQLSDKDLEKHILHVSSLHQQLWGTQYGVDNTPE